MPASVAIKIQGRSLASVGENNNKRPPERYMYQFLARQRIESRMQDYLDQSKPLENQEEDKKTEAK
jgi:hypothetical protein